MAEVDVADEGQLLLTITLYLLLSILNVTVERLSVAVVAPLMLV
jgi:hypothetical protein